MKRIISIFILCSVAFINASMAMDKKNKTPLLLTEKEKRAVIGILPFQKEVVSWFVTPVERIQEKAVVIEKVDSLLAQMPGELQCDGRLEQRIGMLTSLIPVRIVVSYCKIKKFEKENPHLRNLLETSI